MHRRPLTACGPGERMVTHAAESGEEVKAEVSERPAGLRSPSSDGARPQARPIPTSPATPLAVNGARESDSAVTHALAWVHREHLLLAAVVLLGWGATVLYGTLDTAAIIDVLAGLAVAALAMFFSPGGASASPAFWALAAAVSAAATIRYSGLFAPKEAAALAAVIIAAVAIATFSKRKSFAIAGAIAGVASTGLLLSLGWDWSHAVIDVFNTLQAATSALLHGQNPYTPTTSVLLESAPGVWGHVQLPFDYFPGAVLLAAPGRLLGDVRIVSVLGFLTLGAFVSRLALMTADGRTRLFRVVAVCIAAPTTVAMVYFSWLDIYPVAGFAGWLALRRTHPRWAITCLVIALAVKPTLLVALAPLWLWSTRVRRETMVALIATILVFLPFVLMTGPGALFHDTVGVYGQLGFRYDGLTLSAWWYQLTGGMVPVAFGAVVGCLLAFFTLRRRPAELSDGLIVGAVLSTAAFLLSKQAFLNYYFIPEWLLILALASRGVPLDAECDVRLPWPLPSLGLGRMRRRRSAPQAT